MILKILKILEVEELLLFSLFKKIQGEVEFLLLLKSTMGKVETLLGNVTLKLN